MPRLPSLTIPLPLRVSAEEAYQTTTAGSSEGDDVIDIPLHYTAQGDAVQALYCACFVVNEGPEGDSSSLKGGEAAAADPLFEGAVVLNHTSGDYDFVQQQSEFGGMTKATAALFVPPQQQAAEEGEKRPPLLLAGTDAATRGILGAALQQTLTTSRLSRDGAVLVCGLALLWVFSMSLRLVRRKKKETIGWRI
ncbi:hypothetical protein PG994_005363 [Apiospora phragmitis]|uniref:Uncharacterized protein n=1 Tax=Apiospora phragmitis TaxID=2905665 RepID=A0ABR1VC14_9PEZI